MSDDASKDKKPAKKREDLVLTPGGWRSKSKVHKVEPGQHVEVQGGRLKVVESATGRVVADLGAVARETAKPTRTGEPMQRAKRPKTTK